MEFIQASFCTLQPSEQIGKFKRGVRHVSIPEVLCIVTFSSRKSLWRLKNRNSSIQANSNVKSFQSNAMPLFQPTHPLPTTTSYNDLLPLPVHAINETLFKRCAQIVLTKMQRFEVATWMERESQKGTQKFSSKAAAKSTQYARFNTNAILKRTIRYFKVGKNFIKSYKPGKHYNGIYRTNVSTSKITFHIAKAAPGRGRKTAQWVKALNNDLLVTFNSLKEMNMKLNSSLLRMAVLRLITTAQTCSSIER